ncbi:MAG TPA: VWA domain-containing protein [Pyrinomonadaceae bacterium]|nr:VWA domain-containing protein [Pyrinomonadaceae bacterium]
MTETRVSLRRRFGAVAALLIAIAISAGFVCASLAQSESGAQTSSRARRTEDTPQDAPKATPTPPKKEDDVTLPSDEVVRVDTSLTNIFFTAADKQKRFISNLKREDVRILEDGAPQEIFAFNQSVELPLSLAILIDCSGSEERTLPEEKAAARSFLESIMRPAKDEAAIVSFTGEVTLEQGLTGNVARLRRAIDQVEFVPPSGYIGGGVVVGGTPPISGTQQTLAGSTAIWDAIWATSNELLTASAEHQRRAIILLTDGQDTISQVRMQEAIERAVKVDALIYAIGIGDRFQFGINEGALKKITEGTGGRAYFPRNERELRDAFAQIERELREQYLIAYSPSNKARDGSYRRVTIEITNPDLRKDNLRLTYRPGYFAKTPGGTPVENSKKP